MQEQKVVRLGGLWEETPPAGVMVSPTHSYLPRLGRSESQVFGSLPRGTHESSQQTLSHDLLLSSARWRKHTLFNKTDTQTSCTHAMI